MNRRNSSFQTELVQLALLAVLSAGWWGILYPNFSMTEETFQVIEAQETEAFDKTGKTEPLGAVQKADALNAAQRQDAATHFYELLEAEPGQIQVKSKLWNMISEIKGEKENEG